MCVHLCIFSSLIFLLLLTLPGEPGWLIDHSDLSARKDKIRPLANIAQYRDIQAKRDRVSGGRSDCVTELAAQIRKIQGEVSGTTLETLQADSQVKGAELELFSININEQIYAIDANQAIRIKINGIKAGRIGLSPRMNRKTSYFRK